MTDRSLRLAFREWLADNVDPDWRAAMTGTDQIKFRTQQREWLDMLVKGGWATPHWPAGWSGGGRSLSEQVVLFEEIARADAPRLMLYFVSLYHAAMTLIEWGSHMQRHRHLPAILDGEIWCQGFSEPNAGSDLAGLRTRAERRGDYYIVNGQKLWSTMGQYADYCLLLVRTDSSVAKQAGLTYLLLDMRSNGVHVRPIRQATGDEEFSEIFLDSVEIPVENRLGAEGEGWKVTRTTLAAERGLTLVELSTRTRYAMWRLVDAAEKAGRLEEQSVRCAIVSLSSKIDALRALVDTVMAHRAAGNEEIGEASLIKLNYADVLREYTALGLRLGGLNAQFQRPFVLAGGQETGNWMFDFLNSYAWSIAGGSSEIQRNIISERLLGMPR